MSVKYLFIYRHKDRYSISEMCRFFSVSRSRYNDFVKPMDRLSWDSGLAEKMKVSYRLGRHKVICVLRYG